MSYYYSKAVKFIENVTSTEGFYDGIRDILWQAMEAETLCYVLQEEGR